MQPKHSEEDSPVPRILSFYMGLVVVYLYPPPREKAMHTVSWKPNTHAWGQKYKKSSLVKSNCPSNVKPECTHSTTISG